MKRLFTLFITIISLYACNKQTFSSHEEEKVSERVEHGMIVLGKQLDDPYSLANMTKAVNSLYPSRSAEPLSATDIYIRFLPKDENEYNELSRMGVEMIDHPLDYQIIVDGDYYHDPDIEKNNITWQYAVVKKDFKIPKHIRHQILDDCYIPDESVTRADGIDWTLVEKEAYRITGNEDIYEGTRGGRSCPKGRITIEDENYAGGKPIGVSGVKVLCHKFVKFCSTYTDRDGYYTMPASFRWNPRYRLIFSNQKNFDLGLNLIIISASTSALGKGSPEGLDCHITKNSDRKLFTRCVVNNAFYDYITRCDEDDLNVIFPSNLRIWLLDYIDFSMSLMLHQGTTVDYSLLTKYVKDYWPIIRLFAPDIVLGLKHDDTYEKIYEKALKECASASLYSNLGNDYWSKYVAFRIQSFIDSGLSFGKKEDINSGYCGVVGMWSCFLGNKVYEDRYGGTDNMLRSDIWFRPNILNYLYERGLSINRIFDAVNMSVINIEEFRRSLLEKYSDMSTIIEEAFDGTYSE